MNEYRASALELDLPALQKKLDTLRIELEAAALGLEQTKTQRKSALRLRANVIDARDAVEATLAVLHGRISRTGTCTAGKVN